ncbi:MAG: DUF1203 domain-containing protein [Hyphomicrobiaceae bacterium]|nr:DUF1203 domain-containing protein [Hyphomicrobiaceae bacterium]
MRDGRMSIRFVALDTSTVAEFRNGSLDANGQLPERHISTGGLPCRHCLAQIGAGEPYLVLAYRPFPRPQPYAEIGPIFLHAETCPRGGGPEIPALLASPAYIVRAYGQADRIVYGTGGVVDTRRIPARAAELLADPSVAYVHVRSAANNCFQCRVDRA